jgi:hypothetical protein
VQAAPHKKADFSTSHPNNELRRKILSVLTFVRRYQEKTRALGQISGIPVAKS